MVAVVGFAFLGLMVMPVRKQVFLLVITVITNVMHCMTTTAITVQKSGCRPFKKSAFGGEKIATIKGWRYRQKAVVAVVVFALLGLMVTPVRKQVFLLVITVITNVMHCMTTTAITLQKAAVGRSKSPPLAVKNSCLWCSSLTLPKGREC